MTSGNPTSARPFAIAAAATAGVFFLVTAVAHVVVVPARMPVHPTGFGVLQAEIHACMAGGARSHDDCLDEIEGKALIQRAERLAQAGSRPGAQSLEMADDELADIAAPAHPSRSRIQ